MKKVLKLLIGLIIFSVGLWGGESVFAEDSPLTQEEQTIFSQNNIVFYEPCTDSGSGTNEDVGVLEGKDNKERVWNWFAKAGIKGVSDNPVAIAGIMGNIEQESSYNPFSSNGTYYGLYQEDAKSMRDYVEKKCGPVQWGSSTDDAEKNSKAISAELEWLQDHADFKQFVKDLDAPTDKKGEAGARAYAELFLVRYERAVSDKGESIQDKGVYNYMKKMYGGTVYLYQQAKNRRDYAADVYKYVGENSTGSTASSSGATNSDVSSSLHDKAWELADQPGGEQGPTDAYLRAQEEVNCPGDCINHGQSCDRYVGVTLRASGVDTEAPLEGHVGNFEDHILAHPEIYTPVEGDPWDESTYQPGDIRVRLDKDKGPNYRGHIEIYGQREGKGYILSASNGDRWAGYQTFFAADKSNHDYHIYRTQSTPKCITNDGGCAQNSMDVVGTAICLAHPLGTKNSVRSFDGGAPTDNFKTAIDAVFPLDKGRKKWNARSKAGSSCDVGAATVVRYSGVDKKFGRGLDEQHKVKTNDKWELIKPASRSDLQPGDLAYWQHGNSGHVWIYLGKIGKKLYGAHAHYNGRQYLGIEDSTNEAVDWILRPKNAQNTTQITMEMLKNAGKDSVTTSDNSSSGAKSEGSGSAQSINDSAIELAWPAGTSESKYKNDWRDGGEYWRSIGRSGNQGGADCAEFGWTVLRHSGAVTEEENKKYNLTGDEEFKLFTEHPEKWEDLGKIDKSEYKPGDVLLWTKSQTHIAFYVEENGKKYVAEGSHSQHNFGHLVNAYGGAERVFRYKGGGTTNNCDRCENNENDASGTGLKEGGFKTKAEAEAWMKMYRDEACRSDRKYTSYYFKNAWVNAVSGAQGTLNNCVAFSQWFVNYATSIGPKGSATDNGEFMASTLSKTHGLKLGTEPRPYAVFSWHSRHTGVVLGVNGNKMITGEASYHAGCSDKYPGVFEYNIKDSHFKNYAYLESVLDPSKVSN